MSRNVKHKLIIKAWMCPHAGWDFLLRSSFGLMPIKVTLVGDEWNSNPALLCEGLDLLYAIYILVIYPEKVRTIL